MAVLDVLMADETNPRSLDFQLSHLADLYSKMPRHVPEDLKAMQHAVRCYAVLRCKRLTYPLPGSRIRRGTGTNAKGLTALLKELAVAFAHVVE